MRDVFLSRLPKRDGYSATRASASETQDTLLKVLALESNVRQALDGSAHGFRAEIRSLNLSLPHQTILTVLEYMGVSEKWLSFFKRFLNAPLNIGPVVGGTTDVVRTRTAGVPAAHGFEVFFGEAVLFCLDLAVHHRTSSEKTTPYLYRRKYDCYFVGKQEQSEQARQQVDTFAKVMGLNINVNDLFAGETVGFLRFGRNGPHRPAQSKAISVTIDMGKVSSEAHRLKQELSSCSSVYGWVSKWNNTIGTVSYIFGPICSIFGKRYYEAMIRAYNLIFEIVFDGKTLTEHIRDLLPTSVQRQVTNFPLEAFIHLPAAYGGLGVKTPYVALNFAHLMPEDPSKQIKDYLDGEKEFYELALEGFRKLTTKQRAEKLDSIFAGDEERLATVFGPEWKTATATFPSLEELFADRERHPISYRNSYAANPFAPPTYNSPQVPLYNPPSYFYPKPPQYYHHGPAISPPNTYPDLLAAYSMLYIPPIKPFMTASEKVLDEVYNLSGKLDMRSWESLSAEDKWAVGLYGEDVFERFGGLEIWHGESVPREALKVVRGLDTAEEEEWDYID